MLSTLFFTKREKFEKIVKATACFGVEAFRVWWPHFFRYGKTDFINKPFVYTIHPYICSRFADSILYGYIAVRSRRRGIGIGLHMLLQLRGHPPLTGAPVKGVTDDRSGRWLKVIPSFKVSLCTVTL